MATGTITVQTRIVGSEPEVELDTVTLDLPETRTTAAGLIRAAVEEQVRELMVQKKLDARAAKQALNRQYLTAEEVDAQAERGAIRYPSQRGQSVPKIELDIEAEAEKARHAFETGACWLLIDGRRVGDLDEAINLSPGTNITFLRLIPLRGG